LKDRARLPDLQILADVFRKYPDIQAVYLFGSFAAGSALPGSDLDLAIVPRAPSIREERLSILADLVRHGFSNVDLVFLDTDDIVLKYEAVRQNRLVYQAEESLADPERYGSAERFLQLAIEAITDMGNHVIAEMALGVVNSYGDIPAILAEKGYIDASSEEDRYTVGAQSA